MTKEARREAELERIRNTYASYVESGYDSRWVDPAAGMVIVRTERDRWLTEELRPLGPAVVIDLGCGDGNVAITLDAAGIRPTRYVGVDLLPERVRYAAEEVPWGEFHVASADDVPLPDRSADAVVAMTLLSSIIEPSLRRSVADEITRLLRPGGRLLIYDLRYPSPRNPAVRRVRPTDLTALFADWPIDWQAMTLLPPLAKTRLAGTARRYRVLSRLPMMRSHIGAVLIKP